VSSVGSVVGEPVLEREDQRTLRVVDARAEAFRGLVDRSLEGSYRLAAVILNDRVEAEDAVHDAAVRAWRAFGSLREEAAFEAWFQRILVNICRDRLRSRARHRVIDVGHALMDADHPVVGDGTTEAAVRDAVTRALDALPPDERLVVTLRFYGDRTVPQVAQLAGIPEGTVKSRLHRAMGTLRTVLEEADR
jgi:RNA polymerase sigma-70 factor (ECF subfamily)